MWTDVEDCDPLNDWYCRPDCTAIVCGDGVVDQPVENCEPELSAEPCNDNCRLSDNPQWLVELQLGEDDFSFAFLLLDSSQNPVVVLSNSMYDVAPWVYKYDSDGRHIWEWSPGEAVNYLSAAMDSNDHLIAAGRDFVDERPRIDKLDNTGQLLWSTTIGEESLACIGVATDREANIVAATAALDGQFPRPWVGLNPTLEFFDADGTHRPSDRVRIAGNYGVYQALNAGPIGDVRRLLMAGATENSNMVETLLLLLETDGSQVWETPVSYGLPSEHVGYLKALPTGDGDIAVLGCSSPDGLELSFWLERFSPEGTPRWTEKKQLRTSPPLVEQGFPMAVDSEGNVILALQHQDLATGELTIIINKYGPDGSPAWERPLRYDSGNGEVPLGLAVDSAGAIYLLAWRLEFHDTGVDDSISVWLHKWQQPGST